MHNTKNWISANTLLVFKIGQVENGHYSVVIVDMKLVCLSLIRTDSLAYI